MASYTPNLDLLKKNPLTEGSDTFNITTMLNDNWDKIDAKIGNPAELWVWEECSLESAAGYNTAVYNTSTIGIGHTSTSQYMMVWQYSDEIVVSVDGAITLKNPVTVTCDSQANANLLKGKFATRISGDPSQAGLFPLGDIYYFDSSGEVTSNSNGWLFFSANGVYSVYGYPAVFTHLGYVCSPIPTAYPDYDQQGDYWYIKLGQMGDSVNPGDLFVWEKYAYVAASAEVGSSFPTGNVYLWQVTGGAAYMSEANCVTYEYSESITVSADGTVSLVNPTEIKVYATASSGDWGRATPLRGKYFKYKSKSGVGSCNATLADGNIYYLDENATINQTGSYGAIYTQPAFVHYVVSTSEKDASVATGLLKMITDRSEDAYPDSGRAGNYYYLKTGRLGQKVQIQTGSYLSTGTYGATNAMSLTFDFVPKMVMVYSTSGSLSGFAFFNIGSLTKDYQQYAYETAGAMGSGNQQYSYAKISNKTLSWYNTYSASPHLNASSTYYYIAIG